MSVYESQIDSLNYHSYLTYLHCKLFESDEHTFASLTRSSVTVRPDLACCPNAIRFGIAHLGVIDF